MSCEQEKEWVDEEQDHVAEPVPLAPSEIICVPVGVHDIPEGNVSEPETSVTVEPETDIIMLNASPCDTLVGIVTLVIDIDDAASAIELNSIAATNETKQDVILFI